MREGYIYMCVSVSIKHIYICAAAASLLCHQALNIYEISFLIHVFSIVQKIKDVTSINDVNYESFQVLRYENGQYYQVLCTFVHKLISCFLCSEPACILSISISHSFFTFLSPPLHLLLKGTS